jgi:hypothetical protein
VSALVNALRVTSEQPAVRLERCRCSLEWQAAQALSYVTHRVCRTETVSPSVRHRSGCLILDVSLLGRRMEVGRMQTADRVDAPIRAMARTPSQVHKHPHTPTLWLTLRAIS